MLPDELIQQQTGGADDDQDKAADLKEVSHLYVSTVVVVLALPCVNTIAHIAQNIPGGWPGLSDVFPYLRRALNQHFKELAPAPEGYGKSHLSHLASAMMLMLNVFSGVLTERRWI